MAATAATSFSLSSSSSSSTSGPKSLKQSPIPSIFNLGFLGSSSTKAFTALQARAIPSVNNGGSALSAKMVSAPSSMNTPSTTLDFDSSVFNKEKITLSGHDEVFLFHSLSLFYDFHVLFHFN